MPSRGAGSIVHPTLLGCRRPCQTGRVLIDGLAATAERVASTRSRLAKVDALAALLSALEPGEILPAVGFLTAKPRQGRLGVGWRGLTGAMGEPADCRNVHDFAYTSIQHSCVGTADARLPSGRFLEPSTGA